MFAVPPVDPALELTPILAALISSRILDITVALVEPVAKKNGPVELTSAGGLSADMNLYSVPETVI